MLCGQEDFEVVVEMGKYNKKQTFQSPYNAVTKATFLFGFELFPFF